eukprot:6183251-Pleurochrysis_carterae.AAC.1
MRAHAQATKDAVSQACVRATPSVLSMWNVLPYDPVTICLLSWLKAHCGNAHAHALTSYDGHGDSDNAGKDYGDDDGDDVGDDDGDNDGDDVVMMVVVMLVMMLVMAVVMVMVMVMEMVMVTVVTVVVIRDS